MADFYDVMNTNFKQGQDKDITSLETALSFTFQLKWILSQ